MKSAADLDDEVLRLRADVRVGNALCYSFEVIFQIDFINFSQQLFSLTLLIWYGLHKGNESFALLLIVLECWWYLT